MLRRGIHIYVVKQFRDIPIAVSNSFNYLALTEGPGSLAWLVTAREFGSFS